MGWLSLNLFVSRYVFVASSLDYNDGYLSASGIGSTGAAGKSEHNIKLWQFKNGVPSELDLKRFVPTYYTGEGSITPFVRTLAGKNYLFLSTGSQGDVYELEGVAGGPATLATEICGNNIDDDGDGQKDEGCATTPPPPPPGSTSCTASISFDKTSVAYGGSATETWAVNGADLGQVYGDCGQGATPISSGPQSYTIENLSKTTTCRVYGNIAGQEKCTASATVTVGAVPAGTNPNTNTQYFPTATTSNLGTTTLRRGSTGAAVIALQTFLNQETNAGLSTDGKFGPKTKAAVISYQYSNGLTADGAVGPKTRAVMGR